MALFVIPDGPDPLLSVHLETNERIIVASGTTAALSDGLRLRVQMPGGVLRTLTRTMLRGVLPPRQLVEADRAPGDVLLAPTFPGEIRVLEIGQKQYRLPSHALLAASSEILLKTIGRAPARPGGSPIVETSGVGKLALTGFGSIRELQLESDRPVLVNGGQLVGWDSRIVCERADSARGLLFGKRNGGHEHLLRFRGNGSLYICSRRPDAILHRLLRGLPPGIRSAWGIRG